eukprot:Hpha_TRINITY_DN29098_c0_g1::TRINITY_DN29098_c0_g1_i1::g.156519::m.156519
MRGAAVSTVVLVALCAAALGDESVTVGQNETSSPVNIMSTSGSSKSPGLGFIGIAFAAVGFGSNFVVIKKYDPGDGMFFQLCMCIGIFVSGFVFYLIRSSPPIQPVAMLGGVQWTIGNAMCPFIIDTIGMGLGLSVWGTLNMLSGWSGAYFGLFGLTKQAVSDDGMNIAGACVAVLSVLVYAQVKTQTAAASEGGPEAGEDERARVLSVVSKGSARSKTSHSA